LTQFSPKSVFVSNCFECDTQGAAFAAYNFALAMQQRSEDEASVILVSGIAHYLKAPLDGEKNDDSGFVF